MMDESEYDTLVDKLWAGCAAVRGTTANVMDHTSRWAMIVLLHEAHGRYSFCVPETMRRPRPHIEYVGRAFPDCNIQGRASDSLTPSRRRKSYQHPASRSRSDLQRRYNMTSVLRR